MTPRQGKLLLLSVVGALAAGASPALAQPGSLHARSHGESVRATRGSYCWAENGPGVCADFAYPLRTHGSLPVAGRDLVRLRTAKPARRVSVRLVRLQGDQIETLGWDGHAKRSGSTGTNWRVRLPRDLGGATVLDIFVRYAQGDGDFWAGLQKN